MTNAETQTRYSIRHLEIRHSFDIRASTFAISVAYLEDTTEPAALRLIPAERGAASRLGRFLLPQVADAVEPVGAQLEFFA